MRHNRVKNILLIILFASSYKLSITHEVFLPSHTDSSKLERYTLTEKKSLVDDSGLSADAVQGGEYALNKGPCKGCTIYIREITNDKTPIIIFRITHAPIDDVLDNFESKSFYNPLPVANLQLKDAINPYNQNSFNIKPADINSQDSSNTQVTDTNNQSYLKQVYLKRSQEAQKIGRSLVQFVEKIKNTNLSEFSSSFFKGLQDYFSNEIRYLQKAQTITRNALQGAVKGAGVGAVGGMALAVGSKGKLGNSVPIGGAAITGAAVGFVSGAYEGYNQTSNIKGKIILKNK